MKFDSGCGRPSFDDAIPGQVQETMDSDGYRVEITCKSCGGHLGHIFRGEHFTDNNVRHCVNSVSMSFEPHIIPVQHNQEIATFGGGCFRCIEALFQRLEGVELVESGFMGGTTTGPSYEDVCKGKGEHVEVIHIHYDPDVISYRTLLEVFFTSHNPTQLNAQGHDVGIQYASTIFYHHLDQKEQAEQVIATPEQSRIYHPDPIVTQIRQASTFWRAEGYHQDFYNQNSTKPYCQLVINPKISALRKQWGALLKDEYSQEKNK